MFLRDIHCASTMNARRRRVACTIRPSCCCQKAVLPALPSTQRPGRTASASVSVRKGSCRKHGALHIFMTMCHSETRLRLDDVSGITSAEAAAPTTDFITAKTCSRQNSRTLS